MGVDVSPIRKGEHAGVRLKSCGEPQTANGLIRGLQRAGVEVGHSPLNPLDGIDPRWEHWYESGLVSP
jgi:hypothetical protein